MKLKTKNISFISLFSLFLFLSPVLAQTVNVSLPELTVSPGRQISINISVSETSGLDIYSFDATLIYDASVFEIQSVTSQNTQTSIWGPPTYNIQSGTLTIGTGGSDPLSGSGTLVTIVANIPSNTQIGSESDLRLSAFQFNEGTPAVNVTHGSLRIIQDRIAPRFTQELRIQNITAHSARLRFSTDEAARGLVEYGEGSSLSKQMVLEDYKQSRNVTVSGLKANRSYSARVSVWDASGNGPTVSETKQFTTDDIRLSLEAVTGDPGQSVDVPILISDITGQDITSIQLVLEFDAALVSALSVSVDGSLTSGWDAPRFTTGPGSFEVILSGDYAIAGSGRLATVQFYVNDEILPGIDTNILFAESRLNNGSILAQTSPGIIYIRDTTAPEFLSPPLADNIQSQSARLRWEANEAVSALIRYGKDQDLNFEYNMSQYSNTGEAVLTGLLPNQRYYYQLSITDSSQNGPTHSDLLQFRTTQYTGMSIELPDLSLNAGETRSVALKVQGPASSRLYQARVVLTTDAEKIDFVSVRTGKTGWQIHEQITEAGLMAVLLSGSTPVMANENLLHFDIRGTGDFEGDVSIPVKASCYEANFSLNTLLINEALWQVSGKSDVTVPEYLTPPAVEYIDSDRVRVHWVSSEASRYEIRWGDTSELLLSKTGTNQSGYHSEVLSGVSSFSSVYVQVALTDLAGNGPANSETMTFSKPVAPVVRLSADSRQVSPGQTFDWALNISDVSGLEVYSTDIVLNYDEDLLECLSVSNTGGSLTSSWGSPIATISSGQLRIAAGGITALSGSGNLFRLRFRVSGGATPGQAAFLVGSKVILNEGTPSSAFNGGSLNVRDNIRPDFEGGITLFDRSQSEVVFLLRSDEEVSSSVTYGSSTIQQKEKINRLLSRRKAIHLSDLEFESQYDYSVKIEDESGNEQKLQNLTFNTKSPQNVQIVLAGGDLEMANQVEIPIELNSAFTEPLMAIDFVVKAPKTWMTLTQLNLAGCLTENWELESLESNSEGYHVRLTSPVAITGDEKGCLFKLLFAVDNSAQVNQPFDIQ